jgi:hypothetical protein
MLGQHDITARILQAYYDSRLLQPPTEPSDLMVQSVAVDLCTDSCFTFLNPGKSGTCESATHFKGDFGKDVAKHLSGNTKVRHKKQNGALIAHIFTNMQEMRLSTDAGVLKVGLFMCMGNDCYKKSSNGPKKLKDSLSRELLNSIKHAALWMKQNYDFTVMVIGSNARMWQVEQRFDIMIEQLKSAAREAGILVLGGSMAYLGVMITHLEETPNVTVKEWKELFPDEWHPRNSDFTRDQIGKFVANVAKLSLWLKPSFQESPASLLSLTGHEVAALRDRLKRIKKEKGDI